MRNRFKREQIDRWKTVDASTAVRIANASCSGTNFAGCSKYLVYEGFEGGDTLGYKIDRPLFELRMDVAAKITEQSKYQLRIKIGEMLHETKIAS